MTNTDRSNSNAQPTLLAKSNANNGNDVILWADPATHALLISGTIAAGSLTNNNAAPAANNQGVLPAIASAAAQSYTEGNQVLLSTDLAGALRVTGSLSVGGTTDNSAYTAGTSTGTPAMGFYHSTVDTITDGRAATVALTSKRSQHVTLHTAAGVETGIAAAPLQVSLANNGANATAVLVNIASGGIASGAIASGAIASGAIAAGAFATGATSVAENEDVASADGDRGIKVLFKRTDTPANSSGTDGDYEQPQMSGGRLWVDASGKTLTVGSHAVTVASGGIASGAIASGAIASGAVASGAFASGSIASGAIAAGAIATGPTSIAANEDDASANLDTGVKILAIQQSTPADTAGTNADYTMLQMSAGRLWTTANIDKINGVVVLMGNGATGTGSQRVTLANDNTGIATWGHGATAAAVPSGITYQGAQARTSNPTAATEGNSVGLTADKLGKLIAVSAIRDLKGVTQTQISNSTSETTIVAAVASTFMDIYGIILANTGATTTKVTIKDSTSGTTRMIIEVPTLETRGFMLDPGGAVPQATVNNNWTATCAAATTAMEVTVFWVKNI